MPTSRSSGADSLLDALARKHGPALLRHFSRKGFSNADCEDGVQEVMMRLARRADILGNVEKIEGYIFTTAQHVAMDFLRTARRRRIGLHDEYQEPRHARLDHSPGEILESQEDLAIVMLALRELPEKTRSIFALVRLEHMSQVEVARRLNMSLSTVEKHLAKACAYLGQKIERS